jgi:predicted phosphate transport protein (TIGR00153 family)
MANMFSWIKSNDKEILLILDNLAKKAVETAEALVVLFSDLSNTEQHTKIKHLESEADVLTRDIFAELNKTFITPLDREDIQRIASKIDDVIDFMDGISARTHSYKITNPPPYALEIAKELVNATKEVEYMISKLNNIKNTQDMITHCRNTGNIEHTVDDLYRKSIEKLFESNDAISIIKLKDIYETMETASDRCVDVADVIEDIVLKYT